MKLDAVNFNALHLVKLIFGKYFCYFDANRVADLLQLHLQLDAIRVLVHKRVNKVATINLSSQPTSLGSVDRLLRSLLVWHSLEPMHGDLKESGKKF